MEKVKIRIKRLSEGAVLPVYGSEYAAGMDLYALADSDEGIRIAPGETVLIHTGRVRGICVCQKRACVKKRACAGE